MPWKEQEALEQRMMFIAEYESAGGSFTALCARYEVSRMTGYKWLERFENGRHERMHLTLLEACKPPQNTFPGQQRRFDAFRQEFNQERPHEALGDQPPARVYQRSSREYPKRTPEMDYEAGVLTKRVSRHGDISWRGQRFFLNEALGGEDAAFEPLSDGLWLIRFGPMKLAKLDERKRLIKALTMEDLQS